MTTENTEATRAILDAVQTTLNQFADSVRSSFEGLRGEVESERTARAGLEQQVQKLAQLVEASASGAPAGVSEETQRQLTAVAAKLDSLDADGRRRQQEVEDRLTRISTDVQGSLSTMVEAAVAPALRPTTTRQDDVERELTALRASLEKFDTQAARMVSHFGEVTTTLTDRVTATVAELNEGVDARVSGVERRADEFVSGNLQRDADLRAQISKQIDEVEDRLTDRVNVTETRLNEDVGQRIAEIDAYIGRVSVGLDESITALNNRIASVDAQFGEFDGKFNAMADAIAAVDAEAIDELKERMRSAAGEVELIRIEMDRFKESMGDTMDKTSIRLTEVETQMQDQALDTETAVQLERLEEVERALIAIDPSQFVRIDDVAPRQEVAPPRVEAAPAVAAQTDSLEADFTMPSLTDPVSSNGVTASDPLASFAPPAGS